jgi:DNA mismatch repair ATPase MutS
MYTPQNIALIKSLVAKSYVVDALLGVIKYKQQTNASFVNLLESTNDKPQIVFEDMGHPCLAITNSSMKGCVRNSVALGCGTCESHNGGNAIITSPNSSGKSIMIKAIVINILMAQTMGVICSNQGRITPLSYISTQMNVPDSIGHESLFEAEMHRCKDTLDVLEELNGRPQTTPRLSLIVMDEIFNSTNPLEAIAGAYAVCKKMASYQFNSIIFTTHYNYLTKLAKEKNCNFVNYRMETLVNGDNIQFTYRLERGVNKHLLALELLRKTGFESCILDDAISIKNQLTRVQTTKTVKAE